MGAFDEKFLDVPPEVIVTSIKNHQKCFCPSKTPRQGKLANRYHAGLQHDRRRRWRAEIVRGNNKVIAARLSDAKFFWDQDRKTPLARPAAEARSHHLPRQARQPGRAREAHRGAGRRDRQDHRRRCREGETGGAPAKADLVTGMVGEFPELQGLMGRYYALEQGIDAEVADAIRDHYKPQGPSDSIPVSKVGQAVALADKLDTLVGFWAIDEKPRDRRIPTRCRRAALGTRTEFILGRLRPSTSFDRFVPMLARRELVLSFLQETGDRQMRMITRRSKSLRI